MRMHRDRDKSHITGGGSPEPRGGSFMLGRMNSAVSRPLTRAALVALALVLGLSLAACGGSDKKSSPSEAKPSSQPMQGGNTLAALWPLTGLPVHGSTPDHPVMAVKIPNTNEAYPQVGLSQADMVSEELVEGGITRLAVFYYQHVPKLVGPVRSMRASDIGIVKPTHAIIVSSGAAPPTLRRLSHAHVTFFTGGPGYFRDASSAPYNLMVHLRELAKHIAKKKNVVPASYLPWGQESDFKGTKPARKVAVTFSAGQTTRFEYANGRYTNTNSHAPKNDQFHPTSVLVLRVREGDAGYRDPAGNPVPETIFHGGGKLFLFHGGKLIRGSWSKQKLDSALVLKTALGPLKIPAGHVWLELVPAGKNGHVNWSK